MGYRSLVVGASCTSAGCSVHSSSRHSNVFVMASNPYPAVVILTRPVPANGRSRDLGTIVALAPVGSAPRVFPTGWSTSRRRGSQVMRPIQSYSTTWLAIS